LGFDVHHKEKPAHHSKACIDIIFKYPFRVQELEDMAARRCFDLAQHQHHSGQSMEYFDENTKRKYRPHVIKPVVRVERTLLAVVCSTYHEEDVNGELRMVL
jgi:glycyl-tRNA synthetase